MNPILMPPFEGYKVPAACLAIAFVIVYPVYHRLRYGSWL